MPLPIIIPYLIYSTIGLGLLGFYKFRGFSGFKGKKISLAIFGPIQSGKTTIHSFLRGRNYTRQIGTGDDFVDETTVKYKGKDITFKEVKDISGGEGFIKEHYKDMINESDYIILCANALLTVNNEKYKKDIRARLTFINTHNPDKKPLFIVFSHLDKLSKEKEISKIKIKPLVHSKIDKIRPRLNKKTTRIFYSDLTNKDDQNRIRDVFYQ